MLRDGGPFRLLFAGQALSVIGDRITPVAIAFAVLAIGDATDLGLVLAASGVPFALFAIAGGVVSDRVGRRNVMIASDVVRTASQALTAVLLLTGSAEVWMLVVLAAVYGTAAAVFMPALIGLIPQTVPPDRLQEANALLGFTRSIATVGGPAVAGIVIALSGPGEAIALDAATFAVSAACLAALRLRPRAADAPETEADEGLRPAAAGRLARGPLPPVAGLRARRDRRLPRVRAARRLHPRPRARRARARRRLELGGRSSPCFGVGTVVGNVLAMRIPIAPAGARRRARPPRRRHAGGDHHERSRHGRDRGARGARRVAVSLFFTLWDTCIQEQVAPAAVSRVSSYDFAASLGLMPLGMAVAGPLADGVGLQTTLVSDEQRRACSPRSPGSRCPTSGASAAAARRPARRRRPGRAGAGR